MGFYGNITNTGRTHFQFDNIFENRRAMDIACLSGTDNVFAGRFVLVSYDPDARFTAGDILSGFKVNNIIYADASHTIQFYYTNFQQVQPSQANINDWGKYYWNYDNYYIKLPAETCYSAADALAGNYWTPTAEDANDENKCFVTRGQLIRLYNSEENILTETFLVCADGTDNQIATWEPVILDQYYSKYLINYNIDKEYYGVDQALRGYDGTVWQKIYSEGKGKFILIARLNSFMPGLELFPDAPQFLPSAPYIDSKSSESLYRIHVPSHWGFRIKEATAILTDQGTYLYPFSDQKVVQTYPIYYNNELINTIDREINAEIYFNKKASNKLYHYYDIEHDNKIQITPTGASGKTYYDRDGNAVGIDTYELSVQLPMIGNMVSDGYDLIYGYDGLDIVTGLPLRPTDIEWYSGDDTDELKQNGNAALGGKTHDLNTLAGSLNTIHDIMGQIVVNLSEWPSEEQLNSLASQYLYTYDGVYYRKGYVSNKTIVPNSAYNYVQQQNVTESMFIKNKYYYRSENNYVEAQSYDSSLGASGYYLRNINSVRYTPITLIQFQPNRYYLLEGENYLCDNAADYPTYSDRTYYTVTDNGGKIFTGQYLSNGSFYVLENGNYVPSFETAPELGTTYYTMNVADTYNSRRYYHPGSFYYQENNSFILDTEPTYDISKTYYALTFGTTPHYGYSDTGKIIQYYEVVSSEKIDQFSSLPNGHSLDELYIIEDGVYVSYENIKDLHLSQNRDPYTIARTYYILDPTSYPSGSLYIPGVYYIKDSNNSYTKSYEDLDQTIRYYLITNVTEVPDPFYVPSIYYYQQAVDVYGLSQTERMVSGRQYYEKSAMYVENDTTGQCPYGYEWNDYAAYIPPSITLYTAEKKAGLVSISELGKNTNSLYGLLLQLNKMYAPGEESTRDIDTVRGAYNVLRDWLYQIKPLRPNYILWVNDFGQIEPISLSKLKEKLNEV